MRSVSTVYLQPPFPSDEAAFVVSVTRPASPYALAVTTRVTIPSSVQAASCTREAEYQVPFGAQSLSYSDVGDVRPGLDDRVGGDDTVAMKGVTRSGLILGIIAAGVAVTVVGALVLAVQPPKQFDPGTAEATIQGYLQAVIDEDQARAASFMTRDLVKRCGVALNQIQRGPDSFRAVIVDTHFFDNWVYVDVELTEGSGGGVFGDSYVFVETLTLEKSGEDWLIAAAPWPIYCREA